MSNAAAFVTDSDYAPDKELSQLSADMQARTLKSWFLADEQHSSQWRKDARSDYDFVAGDQWTPEEKAVLEGRKVMCVTFNYMLSVIKAVAGSEINSRFQTVYLPRSESTEDAQINEVLTAAGDWCDDQCDAQDEQSEAFEDVLICGMGWTESYTDFDEEPDGKYIESKIDPLEMYWDKDARKKNLVDATRLFRVRRIPIFKARRMFPDAFIEDLHADFVTYSDASAGDPKPEEERRKKLETSVEMDVSTDVTIVHCQWIESETYYRVDLNSLRLEDEQAETGMGEAAALGQFQAKANDKGLVDLSEEEFKYFKSIYKKTASFEHVKLQRNAYKTCFLGNKILGEIKTNVVGQNFSFNCITGQKHRNKGTWFGLVSVMRDPQKWANKWLSQTLHILNTTAKGGIIAEKGAFADQRQASDTYAQPDAITWAEEGAIQKGMIMQKPGGGIVAGYLQLLDFAIKAIRDSVGVNLEILGMRDANQPGILEAQRKQSAMTILATMFDSYRRFKKRVGRVKLFIIQEYFSDGRLIRLVDDQNVVKFIPLLKEKTAGQYDVYVDDAPSSPNMKEKNWAVIQQMLPAFRDMLTPEAVLLILEYSPLPSKLVNAFKEMANQSQQEPNPAQELALKEQTAKIEKDQASAQKALAEAESTKLDSLLKMVQGFVISQNQAQAQAQAQLAPVAQAAPQSPPDQYILEPQNSALPPPPRLPIQGDVASQMPDQPPAMAGTQDMSGLSQSDILAQLAQGLSGPENA